MDRRLLRLGLALRGEGAPVSTPEILDAARAALAVGVERRDDLKAAVRAAIVKDRRFLPDFDRLFDREFPPGIGRAGERGRRRGAREGEGAAGGGTAGGPGGAARASQQAETTRGRPGREEPDAGRRAEGEAEERPPETSDAPSTREAPRPVQDRAATRGERRRILGKGFRERWTPSEEREALEAMEELAERLATRPARRRVAARRGTLDVKATLRANLAHGGVPFRLARRARRIAKRDLVLLADVSGSVRRAAALFLLILGRLRTRFSGVRAFAYTDRPVEIPASLASRPPAEILAGLAAALPLDALSDHGEVFRRFNRDFAGAVGGRSVVVILGDGRNNRAPAQAWEVEAIRRRALRLIWIVPERAALFGSGDSAMPLYAPCCDLLLPAPTPADLAAVADRLVRPVAGIARRAAGRADRTVPRRFRR